MGWVGKGVITVAARVRHIWWMKRYWSWQPEVFQYTARKLSTLRFI